MKVDKHTELIQTTIDVIKHYERWENNREPDYDRIKELEINYKQNANIHVPGIIYVTKSNKIYDGFHRFSAAKNYHYETGINMTVELYRLDTDDNNVVNKYFIDVNKSIPVPDIYLRTEKYKGLCKDIVKYFCEKWPTFKKTSGRPQIPNFNQDILSNDILEILTNSTNNNINKDLVINCIKVTNDHIKKTIVEPKEKCVNNNFYLFLNKNWKNILTNEIDNYSII